MSEGGGGSSALNKRPSRISRTRQDKLRPGPAPPARSPAPPARSPAQPARSRNRVPGRDRFRDCGGAMKIRARSPDCHVFRPDHRGRGAGPVPHAGHPARPSTRAPRCQKPGRRGPSRRIVARTRRFARNGPYARTRGAEAAVESLNGAPRARLRRTICTDIRLSAMYADPKQNACLCLKAIKLVCVCVCVCVDRRSCSRCRASRRGPARVCAEPSRSARRRRASADGCEAPWRGARGLGRLETRCGRSRTSSLQPRPSFELGCGCHSHMLH